MEDRVTIGVPEDEVRLSQKILLSPVTLETLTVRGEVVEDPTVRLRSQLPSSGGQVDKIILLLGKYFDFWTDWKSYLLTVFPSPFPVHFSILRIS